MAQDFSLHKFFKNQYLKEAVSRASSKYVTPTTGIKKSTAEYITDKRKSNAEKETNAMRRPDFEMYDQEDGTRQSYISDKDLMDDEYIQENRARVSMPRFVKDKNNPNFLNVYIDYDLGGGGAAIALGKETMTGQIRRESAAEAMKQATTLAKDLESNYNVEDIEVVDLENGKVRIFAVSDDFINVDFFWKKKSPSITEKSPSIIRKKLAKPPKAKKVASKQKMKLPSGLVNYMDFTKSVAEKLTKSSSVEDHIDDFKDSDAKQFKGKSLDKIKKMALAAFLSKQKK
jgi:hypothetical protein